ncbi:hypothetical protein [Rhodanobacter soli]|uniref:hypothetical protein n=1 Tax=Rhodanobacter soli TaxID=590609 RepID=UPI0031E30A4E
MINCDSVIIGVGPVGLFPVFELGLPKLDAHVIDAVPHAGGQSTSRCAASIRRTQRVMDPSTFQTPIPGIFAVGDIDTYPGKTKLILSGFHEAALGAFAAHAHLRAGTRANLQYTTTSPALQRRLGVHEVARGNTAQPPPRVAVSAA